MTLTIVNGPNLAQLYDCAKFRSNANRRVHFTVKSVNAPNETTRINVFVDSIRRDLQNMQGVWLIVTVVETGKVLKGYFNPERPDSKGHFNEQPSHGPRSLGAILPANSELPTIYHDAGARSLECVLSMDCLSAATVLHVHYMNQQQSPKESRARLVAASEAAYQFDKMRKALELRGMYFAGEPLEMDQVRDALANPTTK